MAKEEQDGKRGVEIGDVFRVREGVLATVASDDGVWVTFDDVEGRVARWRWSEWVLVERPSSNPWASRYEIA